MSLVVDRDSVLFGTRHGDIMNNRLRKISTITVFLFSIPIFLFLYRHYLDLASASSNYRDLSNAFYNYGSIQKSWEKCSELSMNLRTACSRKNMNCDDSVMQAVALPCISGNYHENKSKDLKSLTPLFSFQAANERRLSNGQSIIMQEAESGFINQETYILNIL